MRLLGPWSGTLWWGLLGNAPIPFKHESAEGSGRFRLESSRFNVQDSDHTSCIATLPSSKFEVQAAAE